MTLQRSVAACPIDPVGLIVLRMAIVVAALAAAEFITGGEHEGAGGGEKAAQQGAQIGGARGAAGRVTLSHKMYPV